MKISASLFLLFLLLLPLAYAEGYMEVDLATYENTTVNDTNATNDSFLYEFHVKETETFHIHIDADDPDGDNLHIRYSSPLDKAGVMQVHSTQLHMSLMEAPRFPFPSLLWWKM